MKKEIFKSNRYFTLFDFMVSHGQLLLRSTKDDENDKNIDIVFFGVSYIQCVASFLGISIGVVEENKSIINYGSINSILNNNEYLFEVKTKNESFYIVASYLKVYENELEFNETSLGFTEAKGREIAGSQ